MIEKLTRFKIPPADSSKFTMSLKRGTPSVRFFAVASLVFIFMMIVSVLKLQQFDFALVHAINSVSDRSWIFDEIIRDFTLPMCSNLLVMTLVWYAWFDTDIFDAQAKIVTGVVLSYVAGGLSRIIQLTFPVHPRPLHDQTLHFVLPHGVDPTTLNNWSSFPSDHTAVFFGLATTIFLVSPKLGRIAFILASLLAIPRIYLGYHYPTDVIGGAALGISFVGLTQKLRFHWPFPKIMAASSSNQSVFYAGAFYVCFGIASLFDDFRDLCSGMTKILKAHFLN